MPGCTMAQHDCLPELQPQPPEHHEYMTMVDTQSVLHTEFPGIYTPSEEEKDMYKSCGYKSAPSSRNTSYCSDYLTHQEVGRMIRREVLAVRRGHELLAVRRGREVLAVRRGREVLAVRCWA